MAKETFQMEKETYMQIRAKLVTCANTYKRPNGKRDLHAHRCKKLIMCANASFVGHFWTSFLVKIVLFCIGLSTLSAPDERTMDVAKEAYVCDRQKRHMYWTKETYVSPFPL